MDSNYINILSNRCESVSSAQMSKSLGKSDINLYSNIACSALGVVNQQNLSNDLEWTHFFTLRCKDSHVICTTTSVLFYLLYQLA